MNREGRYFVTTFFYACIFRQKLPGKIISLNSRKRRI